MNIGAAIRQIARQGNQSGACISICQVTAVDADARTIDVQPLDDSAPILGVNLQANQGSTVGVVQVPKAGSYAVVGMLDGYTAGVCLLCDELERVEVTTGDSTMVISGEGIELNGGSLGGMVKVEGLTARLNAIEDEINSLKTAITAAPIGSMDGGAAFKGGLSSWAGRTLAKSKRGDYENERVKQ